MQSIHLSKMPKVCKSNSSGEKFQNGCRSAGPGVLHFGVVLAIAAGGVASVRRRRECAPVVCRAGEWWRETAASYRLSSAPMCVGSHRRFLAEGQTGIETCQSNRFLGLTRWLHRYRNGIRFLQDSKRNS